MIRKNFFLKKKWFFLIVALMLYALLVWQGFLVWLVLFVGCGVIWLHRRRDVQWHDTVKSNGELFLSPVDGEIVRIGEWIDPEAGFKYSELQLKISPLNNWGLHLPSSSEMEYLKSYAGRRIRRQDLASIETETSGDVSKTDMVLRNKSGLASRLRFIHCEFGGTPKIWMKSGDRGRGAACFGYYPFGGSLIVYVPYPSDILVVENEKTTAGQTVLAVFRTPQEA